MTAALALLLLSWSNPPARAAKIFENVAVTSAPALDMDPSVRSAAMGGASSAVFWGADANHWANPALLGFARGVRYEQADIKPIPGALPDARFETRRTTVGYGGLGVALAGEPADGMGRTSLDYGVLPAGYFTGQTGPLPFREKVRTWGAGVSAAGIAQSLAALRNHAAPELTRWADVAVGVNRKRVEDPPFDPEIASRATSWDWGLVARASVPFAGNQRLAPERIDIAYGYSVLNANDTDLGLHAAARHHRHGISLHAQFDGPAEWIRALPHWLAPGLQPVVSAGMAVDYDRITAGSSSGGAYRQDGYGGEIALANLLFARVGHARRTLGDGESGDTWGVGAGLPIGRWAAVRYDRAHVARNSLRGDMGPDSWSVWIDPVAVYHDAR